MRSDDPFVRELDLWAHQPTTLSSPEAARRVAGRLGEPPPPRRRAVLAPVAAAVAAAAALLVAAHLALRERAAPPPESSTTATITLQSGTLVVIDLGEVRR